VSKVSVTRHAMAAGNHDAQAADFRGRGDAEQVTVGIHERAAGKASVHRRRRADHFFDRAAAPGRQGTADDRTRCRSSR
jgi:hypothetical protein